MHTHKYLSPFVSTCGRLAILIAMLMVGLIGSVIPAAAAPVAFDLCATSGSTSMPDGASVTVWGYVLGDCTGSPTVSISGGPTLEVNEGDVVTINLHNNLSVNTGLFFQGQALVPDTVGTSSGGTKSYVFTATNPGTYLYEAGLLPGAQYQTAMGLHGSLIVRPATPGQAYHDASTAFDDEAVLVLSEIDPALNDNANPAAFDMRNYNPRYFLINGKAYPDTDEIATTAEARILLRYLNAGIKIHSMALLGTHQTVIANDGSPLAYPHRMVAESFGPGQTVDAIAVFPASAAIDSLFAIYDGNLMLRNSNQAGFGGMLTFITFGPPLAVTLASFTAVPQGDHVLVSWETVDEVDTMGFNLYRSLSADGERTRLTFVPAQNPGGAAGASYAYPDADVAAGRVYYYWLEDIDMAGVATLHGPVIAKYSVPTAVSLIGIQTSPADSALPVAVVLLATATSLVSALAVRRRRG